MAIRIEFYGIARQRTQTPDVNIPDSDAAMTLGQLLQHVAGLFPDLKDECISGERLQAGFVANIDGQHFVSDPTQIVKPGQSVLIMSADAGG